MQILKTERPDEDTVVTLGQNMVTMDYLVEVTWDGTVEGRYSYQRLDDARSRFNQEVGERA
jgi:acyl-CoA thioesterase FadM